MTISKICKIVGIILAFVLSVTLLYMVAAITLRYPGNHGESMFNLFYVLIAVLVGSTIICFKQPRLATALAIVSILGMIAVREVDRRNIMVSYDEWIKRGMPKWGQNAENVREENIKFWEEQGKREYILNSSIGAISDVGGTVLRGLNIEWLRFTLNPLSGIFNAATKCSKSAYEKMCETKNLTEEGTSEFPPIGIVVDDDRFIPVPPVEGRTAWGWSMWQDERGQHGKALLVLYFVPPQADETLGTLYIYVRYKESLKICEKGKAVSDG